MKTIGYFCWYYAFTTFRCQWLTEGQASVHSIVTGRTMVTRQLQEHPWLFSGYFSWQCMMISQNKKQTFTDSSFFCLFFFNFLPHSIGSKRRWTVKYVGKSFWVKDIYIFLKTLWKPLWTRCHYRGSLSLPHPIRSMKNLSSSDAYDMAILDSEQVENLCHSRHNIPARTPRLTQR